MKFKGQLRNLWRRAPRRWRWLVIALIPFIIIRALLPYGVESYVNHQLNKSREYGGRISNVDMQLWRGQYRINGIKIFKRTDGHEVPFFSSSRIDLSVEWKELVHGAVVGKVILQRPRLNFISGPPSEETVKSSKDEGWDKILESLFPFDLNRVEIKDGEIHFQNPHSNPPVDIYLHELSATATNLNNSRDLKQALPAGLVAHGTTIGGGGLDLELQLNPMTAAPTYQITCQLTNVDVTALNGFLKAYGKFDVAHGRFGLYTSVAAKDGNYEGYLKVFFDNLDVFQWEKERKKNALEVFWQAIVGGLTTAFKNQRTDSLATRIPISGSYQKGSVGIWSAVGTLLRNAFVRALVPKLDEPVTIQQVEKKIDQKEETHPQEASSSPAPKAAKP